MRDAVATSPPESAAPIVAVVDDDANIQTVLGRMLQYHGFVPVFASELAGVVAVAEQHHLSAFMVDLHLARGQRGVVVLEWVRAQPRYADTPILVLTGEAAIEPQVEAALNLHHAHVFHKGQSLLPLMEHLRRLLALDQ